MGDAMPYVTKINGALVEVGVDGSIVTIPSTSVLNDFGESVEFSQYEVQEDDTGAENVEAGEYLAPIIDGEPEPGTYLGSGSMANAGLELGDISGGFLGLTPGISATLNPIDGHFFEDEDGNVSMITDQPLNAEHLGVSLTVKLPGVNATEVNVPLSELNATVQSLDPTGALGSILGGTTDFAQYLLDTAAVTLDFDPEGEMTLDESEIIVCYLAGTKIMTDEGPIAIENLREGQLVVCRFGGLRPILWIGRQHFTEERAAGHEAIRFAPGSLGHNIPREPLFVSPGHSMLVGDVLVLAKSLVNGLTITREAPRHVWSYFQLDLGVHDLLLANGAWSESFADCEDFRKKFDNYDEFSSRHAEYVAPAEPDLCADRPYSGPKLYEAVHATAERAFVLEPNLEHGRLTGRIEDIEASRYVSGWAMDCSHPDRPVLLEVLLDDAVIGRTVACIRDATHTSGKKLFLFDAERQLSTDEQLRLVVRRVQDAAILAPLRNGIAGDLQGHLDMIAKDGLVNGWARDSEEPGQPVLLEVVVDDEVVGTVLASRERRDLKKAGLGNVAFAFRMDRSLSAEQMASLYLRSACDGRILRRSEKTRVDHSTPADAA